jgi:hypothetical protein
LANKVLRSFELKENLILPTRLFFLPMLYVPLTYVVWIVRQ